MGLKVTASARFLGRTVEASKNSKKFCYTFIQGEKLESETSGKQKGMYLDPQVLTWWTTENIQLAYEQLVQLYVDVVGESTVVTGIAS